MFMSFRQRALTILSPSTKKKLSDWTRKQMLQKPQKSEADFRWFAGKLIGYFPMKNINDKLSVKSILISCRPLLTSALMFWHDLCPCLRKACPAMFKIKDLWRSDSKAFWILRFSLNQLYDGLEYIGCEYEKIIEIYNHQIQQMYQFDTSHTYFDCTNFYFEIDREDDFRKRAFQGNRKNRLLVWDSCLMQIRFPSAWSCFRAIRVKSRWSEISLMIWKEKLCVRQNHTDRRQRVELCWKYLPCAQNGMDIFL